MWTINSNDVEQAKDRLERRRTEIEARYAEEKSALDAEASVIEMLDRAAAEFAVRHNRENFTAGAHSLASAEPPLDAPSPAPAEPPVGNPDDGGADMEAAPDAVPPSDPPAPEEGGGLDILKPGSRWRLNRANRLLNPENTSDEKTGTTPGSW